MSLPGPKSEARKVRQVSPPRTAEPLAWLAPIESTEQGAIPPTNADLCRSSWHRRTISAPDGSASRVDRGDTYQGKSSPSSISGGVSTALKEPSGLAVFKSRICVRNTAIEIAEFAASTT